MRVCFKNNQLIFSGPTKDAEPIECCTQQQCVCLANSIWRSTSNPRCHVTFSKTKINVNWHLHFHLKCHLNVVCLVVRVISIFKVSIDAWVFSFTSHTTCQNLNYVCQLMCNFILFKFLHVKCQKLAKTLSKIHTAQQHWGPLHTRDWEPMTNTLQALSLVAEPFQVHFTLRLRDQQSMWMQDGCEVHVDSYMALNGSCFMVTWIIFKNHLLEVGRTQNWETTALRTLTTVDLFYFIMCEDPHE